MDLAAFRNDRRAGQGEACVVATFDRVERRAAAGEKLKSEIEGELRVPVKDSS
jgi:hypothetical protein